MLWPCRVKCVCRIRTNRRQVARAIPSVLFIIHYLCMRSFKNDCENWSGQNRTSRTACYSHVIEIVTFSITYPTMSTHTMVRYQQYVGPVSYITFDQSVQGSKRLLVASESGVLAAINTRTGNISKDSLRHTAVWLHPPSFLEYQ